MKIGYFADGPWSHLALDKILSSDKFSIAFIVARFDKPDPFLRAKSANLGIPFFVDNDINSNKFLGILAKFDCDLYVSMSFNQIFQEAIISQTPNGIINCHAGKLPFYRGRNVLNWALINDEKDFGVTVHYVDKGIDTGDIILQKTYEINDSDDYGTLLSRAYEYCSEVLYEAIVSLADGSAKRVVQNDLHPVGFYCSQRRAGDEVINWNQSSRDVFNFVRALTSPGPNALTFSGSSEVQIIKVEMIENAPVYKGVPGAVIGIEKNAFYVKTATSFVKVISWVSNSKIMIGDRLK